MAECYACEDVEDLRRRCVAHAQWIAIHPENVAFAESWADQALELIGGM
ncbi:hypothetical protein [Mycobacterium sp. 48b]